MNTQEMKQMLDSKAEAPREAPGWNGPKGDPNYDSSGRWVGQVPDTDAPTNNLAGYRADLLDQDTLIKVQGKAHTWATDINGQPVKPTADPDAWRAAFTARIDALGLLVGYRMDSGEILVYNDGATSDAPMYTFRNTESALSWLTREESERALARATAAQKQYDARDALSDTSNPVAQGALIEQLLARVTELEKKLA